MPTPVSATVSTTRPSAGRGRQRDRAARRGVGDGVVQQVVQRLPEPVGVDARPAGSGSSATTSSSTCLSSARGAHRVGRAPEQLGRVLGPECRPVLRPLQPGQGQQVLDQRQQPLGVVAGVEQQFGLLRRERADRLLEQDVDGQPDAVSGVFSSWLTVATRSVLNWSSSRNRVTSLSTTAAPRVSPSGSRIGRTCGRYVRSSPPSRNVTAWSNPSGRYARCCPQRVGERLAERLGRLPHRAGFAAGVGPTPNSARAAGLASSDPPAGSTTSTGSGNESMVAWAVCWARSSRARFDWRYVAQLAGSSR